MTQVTIETGTPTAPDARALLQASHDLMGSLFPQEANHFLSVEALEAPHIKFFLAKDGDASLGCAALANHTTYGEVKSMYVDETARNRGVADRLMQQLVQEANAQSLPCMKLEPGTGLDAAHRLYERHGFSDCDAFGDYQADAPYSRYMELTL